MVKAAPFIYLFLINVVIFIQLQLSAAPFKQKPDRAQAEKLVAEKGASCAHSGSGLE